MMHSRLIYAYGGTTMKFLLHLLILIGVMKPYAGMASVFQKNCPEILDQAAEGGGQGMSGNCSGSDHTVK